MRSADFKLLARLLPELYSTQSNYMYYYLLLWQYKRLDAQSKN